MFMEPWILWVSCKVNMKPKSLAKLTWSLKGFTYFARDPNYSWFHAHSKNRFHFLNIDIKLQEFFLCALYLPWLSVRLSSINQKLRRILFYFSLTNEHWYGPGIGFLESKLSLPEAKQRQYNMYTCLNIVVSALDLRDRGSKPRWDDLLRANKF